MNLPLAHVEFRSSSIHGLGGFANVAIPAGSRVIEYVGERITKEQALDYCSRDNSFIFCLDETWDLDGSVDWNPARRMNHCCEPNCDAENIEGRIWIVARRLIQQGEEITYNYGYDLVDYREHPCRCGSPQCVGYIVAEELFDLLRSRVSMPAKL